MVSTASEKVFMTVSVDEQTRKLCRKYGGRRGIGKLLSALMQKHDSNETFGASMMTARLERIEERLIELLDIKK